MSLVIIIMLNIDEYVGKYFSLPNREPFLVTNLQLYFWCKGERLVQLYIEFSMPPIDD